MDNFLSFERVQAAQWRGAHMMGCLTCVSGCLAPVVQQQLSNALSATGTIMYYLHPE